MKRLIYIFIVLLFISINCGPGKQKSRFELPKNYRNWKRPVDKVLDYTVPGHGPTYRVIYANDISFNPDIISDSGGRKKIIMKEGAVIIKEVYKKREDINVKEPMLTIMKKDKNNPHSINGWLFIVKKPGKEIKDITGRLCVGCHEAANEAHLYFDRNPGSIFRDYLFVPFVKK